MPRRLHISCFVLFALAFALPARPVAAQKHTHRAPKRTTRATIEALEDQWRQAQLTGDVAAMDHLLADDYLGIGVAGQVNTKALQLARMRNHSVTFTQLDPSDVKIKIAGQVAIVTSLVEVRGTADTTPIAGSVRSTRIYQQNSSGVWKLISSEVTRVSPTNGGTKRDATNSPAA